MGLNGCQQRRGYDDGTVVLVAPNERRVRIATGDGARAILTDARCRQCSRKKSCPSFAMPICRTAPRLAPTPLWKRWGRGG
ncbi:TPM domain-containing protein [Sphingomonas daechungensis]|uniref:TPM domain-containing protein n=1 Tax=Sphingomonas daechungensis TaxID=1176646 RepID=A0ABX6T5Z3_9SPHN|nr:TPM domain-containing protein [Sphingomonas daechungensis]